MVSVLDLEQYHLRAPTFEKAWTQATPYSGPPVILMLFLSKRCQFRAVLSRRITTIRPSQDDQTHHADGLDDLVNVLVEPNGIEPLTS